MTPEKRAAARWKKHHSTRWRARAGEPVNALKERYDSRKARVSAKQETSFSTLARAPGSQ